MQSLKTLRSEAATCRACPLWKRGTNVVKHFKWKERGKKRIHDKPSGAEVKACFPWLEAEIAAVKPDVVLATVHPSSILREPDRDARHAAEAAFVRDLAKVGTWKSE